MQVTETAAEGLKREFKVTVAASEIESRVQSRLARLARTVKLPDGRQVFAGSSFDTGPASEGQLER